MSISIKKILKSEGFVLHGSQFKVELSHKRCQKNKIQEVKIKWMQINNHNWLLFTWEPSKNRNMKLKAFSYAMEPID